MYQYISLLEISNAFRSWKRILVVTGNKDPGRVATWPGYRLATEMLVILAINYRTASPCRRRVQNSLFPTFLTLHLLHSQKTLIF